MDCLEPKKSAVDWHTKQNIVFRNNILVQWTRKVDVVRDFLAVTKQLESLCGIVPVQPCMGVHQDHPTDAPLTSKVELKLLLASLIVG